VAEWLRRWIANPLLYERESSNLSSVELYVLFMALLVESFFSLWGSLFSWEEKLVAPLIATPKQ
jgi:hypothetical protein